jgi:hypothetical protein
VVPLIEMTSPSATVDVADGEPPGGDVDRDLVGAAHRGLAHAACDDGGVADQPAARGQDPLGGDHPVQVVGSGLLADEDDVLAVSAREPRPRRR